MTHDVRELVVARLREAVAVKRLTHDEVATRAGLHPRTVQRLLEGRTFSPATAQAVSRALRVDLDSRGPAAEHDGAGRGNAVQSGAALSPVVGWEQAALVLRISRWTLRRARRGQPRRRPWWPSRDAVLEWFAGLVTGV